VVNLASDSTAVAKENSLALSGGGGERERERERESPLVPHTRGVSAAYHANRNEIFRERNVGARGLSVRIIKLDGYYGRYGGKKLRGRSTAGRRRAWGDRRSLYSSGGIS